MNNQEKLEKAKSERLGEINISNEGYKMKVVEYEGKDNIIVEFQDKHKAKIHTLYGNIKLGNVKNPYHLSVYGLGYIGQGKYKAYINNKSTIAYQYWKDMLDRCYNPYSLNRRPCYIDCYVCELWHCFQNFAEWFYENYYEIPNEKMNLDKDILIKGNKIYSPETCIFVPQRINTLFIKNKEKRGCYPIGVRWHKRDKKFESNCSILDENNKRKQIYLGRFNTSEEAFLPYKKFKENYIKQVADEYKEIIPNKLYEALYKYEVGIND